MTDGSQSAWNEGRKFHEGQLWDTSVHCSVDDSIVLESAVALFGMQSDMKKEKWMVYTGLFEALLSWV